MAERRYRNPWRYWLVGVPLLALLGLALSIRLESSHGWIELRYQATQYVSSWSYRRPRARDTILVLVRDITVPALASRRPIKRDYLARLVRLAADADVRLIAIDFHFHGASYADYEAETQLLVDELRRAADRAVVVLPRTITGNGASGGRQYSIAPDIADWIPDLSDAANGAPDGRGFASGYIRLPKDKRELPLPVRLNDGRVLPSFALAIVRAYDPLEDEIAPLVPSSPPPQIWFAPQDQFVVYDAGELLSGVRTLANAKGKIVVISGDWATTTGRVDAYSTPIGELPGAVIHANYVEAILDRRYFFPYGHRALYSIDVIVTVLLAAAFWKFERFLAKIAIVGGGVALLLATAVFSAQMFGRSLDVVLSSVPVLVHGLLEPTAEFLRPSFSRALRRARRPVRRRLLKLLGRR